MDHQPYGSVTFFAKRCLAMRVLFDRVHETHLAVRVYPFDDDTCYEDEAVRIAGLLDTASDPERAFEALRRRRQAGR